jgi:uncharacterized protein (TIGR03000 family)
MHVPNRLTGKPAFLAVLLLLSAHLPAQAQILSKWGHPVVTFGWTPYDWDETGLGNYHGKPPYDPGCVFDHKVVIPQPADEGPPSGAALVIVKLPADAELWFDDTKTTQAGSYRRFVTPLLESSRRHIYTLRVRWNVQDAELTRVEKVQVEAGDRVTVNFLTTDSWTGVRAQTLPQPRKLP